MAFNGAEKYMLSIPIKHESVFKWAMERVVIKGESKLYNAFKSRLSANHNSVDWAGSWYSGSVELIPSELRSVVKGNILEFLPAMTVEEVRKFESWRIDAADNSVKRLVEDLSVELHKVLLGRFPKKYILNLVGLGNVSVASVSIGLGGKEAKNSYVHRIFCFLKSFFRVS
jgi:hypothetical protein